MTDKPKSDTPRTDEASTGCLGMFHRDSEGALIRAIYFARDVERELNTSNAEITRLQIANDNLIGLLREVMAGRPQESIEYVELQIQKILGD